MADKDPQAPGILEQARNLFATLDKPRRPGYIGQIPYLLILRWFTFLGIVLRFLLHSREYDGRVVPVVAASLVALLVAIILTKWRIDPRRGSALWKALVVVVFDTGVISVAYLSTQRLQSDSFLFFFLPLLTAAEYLTTAWIAGVFVAITAAFYAIIYHIHFVDHTADMTVREAFLRVYLGREFFLCGMVCTAWYLFQRERQQQVRLENALD